MTTGPPLYLVSACGSAEEFVAAFRRYADRTGLFIPSASPLPAGRRGRLALTLKDGGVMIEGEAEILQSSVKPTVLHGRPGMTVKFVEPDEPSKIVIGELEKARLAMKPAPPSVPPRPADIPASPRPVPPAPSGRIDAANSLAECIVIGDPSTLATTASAPRPAMGSFVVPSIPAVAAPRPKTPSTPPDVTAKPPPKPAAPPPSPPAVPMAASSAASKSEKMTSLGFPAVDKAPAKTESGRVVSNATTLGMPALERKPAENPLLQTKLGNEPPPNPTPPSMPAQNPLLETKLGHAAPRADATPSKVPLQPPRAPLQGTPPPDGGGAAKAITHEETTTIGQGPAKPADTKSITAARPLVDPIGEDEATAIGAIPTRKTTDPMPAAAPKPTPSSTPIAALLDTQRADNPRNDAKQQPKATSIGFPVVGRNVFETQPLGLVPPAAPIPGEPIEPAPPTLPKTGGRQQAHAPAARGKNPTAPPMTPRHPTPVAPVPIVRPPAKAAPSVNAEEEKTDLGSAPTATATPVEPASAIDSGALFPAPRSGGMRASEILAAIPAGDWTMAPDESVPHALGSDEKFGAAGAPPQEPTPAPAPPPKGPPTGDWTIQLDPETGWSEPEKLAKAPATASSGNPDIAVSSDKPINVVRWDDKPTGIGESKIEVDSTLMEPLKAMPADDDAAQIVDRPASDVPPPLAPMPPRPTSGFGLTDQAGYMQPPMMPPHRQSSTDMMSGFAPMTVPIGAQDPAQRKKMILLAIGAGAVAIGAIVMLVLTLGGKDKKPTPAATTGGGSAKVLAPEPVTADAGVVAPTGSGSQQVAVDPVGSGEVRKMPVVQDKPVPTGPCKVDLKSNPPGADIYVGAQKLGTTPEMIELPCGAEAKLTLKKKQFPNTVRSYTPNAAKANKLTIKLTRTQFSVKVTSTPPGATITLGGKSLGVTPSTIKLPGFDTTALTLTKPGFATETSRVNPKQNNASHHVTLKKGKGR